MLYGHVDKQDERLRHMEILRRSQDQALHRLGYEGDADGYIWMMGRIDDVLNVSGHRLGTMEVESALVAHDRVVEAAVVGYPHEIKGEGIFAYVVLRGDRPSDDDTQALVAELRDWVGREIGAIAKPDEIRFTENLPKTRSGKIMRRILRKIAANEHEQLGDTSTLADPSVVDTLIEERLNK